MGSLRGREAGLRCRDPRSRERVEGRGGRSGAGVWSLEEWVATGNGGSGVSRIPWTEGFRGVLKRRWGRRVLRRWPRLGGVVCREGPTVGGRGAPRGLAGPREDVGFPERVRSVVKTKVGSGSDRTE